MSGIFIPVEATGGEIEETTNELLKITETKPTAVAVMSCVLLACLTQEPDMTPDQCIKAVKDICDYISFYLAELDQDQAVN